MPQAADANRSTAAVSSSNAVFITGNPAQAVVAQDKVEFAIGGAAIYVRPLAGRGQVYRDSPGERDCQDKDSCQGQVYDTFPPFCFC